jgi:hypothetical protein
MTTQDKILLVHTLMLEIASEIEIKANNIQDINSALSRNLIEDAFDMKVKAKNYNSPTSPFAVDLINKLNHVDTLTN